MNTQVFLVNSYNAGHDNNTTSLQKGQLGMYGYDPNNMSLVNAIQLASTEKCFLALGRGNGKAYVGRDIDIPVRHRNFLFKKSPYKKPIKQKVRLSISGSGQSHYDEFSVTINHRFGFDESGIETNVVTFSVVGKFASPRDVYDALVREITQTQKNWDRVVTAEATDAGLVLTANFDNLIYEAVLNYIPFKDECSDHCVDYNIVCQTLVKSEAGSGYPSHVRWLWNRNSVWTGTAFQENIYHKDPQRDFILYSEENDVYELTWTNQNQPQEDNGSVAFNVFQTIMLVVPTTVNIDRIIDNIETLLGVKLTIAPTL